jgi:O-antigen ligase
LGVWPWFGGGVSWETVVDSQYARVLIETGVVGMAAFVFLFYRIMRTAREAHRWSRDWVAKGLSLGVSAAFVGLIVHGLATITFLIVRIMEPFWFLAALAVVARQVALADHERRVVEYRRANAPTSPQAQPTQAQPAQA